MTASATTVVSLPVVAVAVADVQRVMTLWMMKSDWMWVMVIVIVIVIVIVAVAVVVVVGGVFDGIDSIVHSHVPVTDRSDVVRDCDMSTGSVSIDHLA